MNMTMNRQENDIEPFVPVPRYISKDTRSGKLTYRQYELYIWIRLQADMLGSATVSTGGLLAELPHFKSEDNISKFLRELRGLKYLYYAPRQGHRGTFVIEFGDWMLKGGKIKSLDKFFGDTKLRSVSVPLSEAHAEVAPKMDTQTPKLRGEKSDSSIGQILKPRQAELRSQYTDTETDTDTNVHTLKKSLKRTRARDFVPNPENREEYECKRIALGVGEEYINPLLKVLRTDGFRIIEHARDLYKEDRAAGKEISNPPAYFYGIIKKLREQRDEGKRL